MKTNPWMIVSLVLACACGFLVGVLVSQPAEVSADKHDWDYSITSFIGQVIATRWDRNAENPLPEMMVLRTGFQKGESDYETDPSWDNGLNGGVWSKVKILDKPAVQKLGLQDKVVKPKDRPWSERQIENLISHGDYTEEEKQALREAYWEANREWERNN